MKIPVIITGTVIMALSIFLVNILSYTNALVFLLILLLFSVISAILFSIVYIKTSINKNKIEKKNIAKHSIYLLKMRGNVRMSLGKITEKDIKIREKNIHIPMK